MRAQAHVMSTHNADVLLSCERLERFVEEEQRALIQAARQLQARYQAERTDREMRAAHLELIIRIGCTLVIQWSRRRRIKRTPSGRKWWWDRMPYDAGRKTYPPRILVRGLSREEGRHVTDIEMEAQRLRERWAETTRFLITLRALCSHASGIQSPPWIGDHGDILLAAFPAIEPIDEHADIAIDTFGGSIALHLHALRAELIRDARALAGWVKQERTDSSLRLRVDIRGSSLDLAWYVGASPGERLPVTKSASTSKVALGRLIDPRDAHLVAEVERSARFLRVASSRLARLLAQTRTMRRREVEFAAGRRAFEFAMGPARDIPRGHTWSP